MAYRKRRTTRKTTRRTTRKRRSAARVYGTVSKTMPYSLGKNVNQTYKVVLSEYINLDSFQGLADDELRTRNLRMAQIIGCRKWNDYAGLFQEFKVDKVTVTCFYRPVERTTINGAATQDRYRVQGFRIGLYTDARQEHANAAITGIGNEIWEHQNMKFFDLDQGQTCSFNLPYLRGNVYVTNITAFTTGETETRARPFWQNTYTSDSVDSLVKVRMGQLVISNPGIPSGELIVDQDRVQITVRYYVQFRGAQL